MRASYLALIAVTTLAACGEDMFTIRGTVTGLSGTGLVLTNNGGDEIAITGDGEFAFAKQLPRGAAVSVAVSAQPASPAQMCDVAGGDGKAGDTLSITVTCTTRAYAIHGTVTGLDGSGFVIQNNGGDNLPISANGAFTFPTGVPSGSAYAISVLSQPSARTQLCSVTAGTGTVADADVTNVAIDCVTQKFTIGGTVVGLAGSGLVLQDNGGDDLAISADGTFTFATPVASGDSFTVTTSGQPDSLSQTCTVSGGTGTVLAGNVTSITVNCMTNHFTIGGTVTGLAGTGLVLQDNSGDDLSINSNGTFAFATPIISGGTYSVTVATNPTNRWQTCTVAMGSGTVTNHDITTVAINCTTNAYTIGGMVSGLAAGDSLVLKNNGGNNLTVSANGNFTFTQAVLSGDAYAVTAVDPVSPISQHCVVTSGSGMVTNSNITNVMVACTTNKFSIRAVVAGMTGTGLVVKDNGTDTMTIDMDGTYTFATQLASGTQWHVQITTQPTGQPCTVGNSIGTVGAANVNVIISCGTKTWNSGMFPVGPVTGDSYGMGDMAFDANGDLLMSVASPTFAVVKVDRLTGAQSTIATLSTLASGSYLMGIAYRASNNMIYVSTDGGAIYSVTPTGTVTFLVAGPGQLSALAIAPATFGAYADFVIGVTNAGTVFAMNPSTNAITNIATTSATSDLAFAPDGTLYVCGGTSIRTVSATGTVVSIATNYGSADGITFSPDGTKAFIADSGVDQVYQLTIPGLVRTSVGSYDIDDGWGPGGILADPGNTVLVMTGESTMTLRAFNY